MSENLPAPISEADYAAIEAAVMETARGRWFLAEFARRNRNADTRLVLDAVARLEATLNAGTDIPAGDPENDAPLLPAYEATVALDDQDADAAPRACPDAEADANLPCEDLIDVAADPQAAAKVLEDPGIVDPEAMLLDWTEDAVPAIVLGEPAMTRPRTGHAPADTLPDTIEEDITDLDDILAPDPEPARNPDDPDIDDDCPRAAADMSPTQSLVLFS